MVADEVYANVGSAGLRYDAVLSDKGPAPAIVCIHGGGWVSGDRSDMHEVAQYFAEKGFAAFCPQYRLAPLYSYPAPIEDIESFIKYLRENSEKLDILPESIGGSRRQSAPSRVARVQERCHAILIVQSDDKVNIAIQMDENISLGAAQFQPKMRRGSSSWVFPLIGSRSPATLASTRWCSVREASIAVPLSSPRSSPPTS